MEYSVVDKITQWIRKNFDEDYTYEGNDFRIMMNDDEELEFLFWNLNVDRPDLKIIETIDMSNYVKRFPKNSIEDIIQRLEQLEKK